MMGLEIDCNYLIEFLKFIVFKLNCIKFNSIQLLLIILLTIITDNYYYRSLSILFYISFKFTHGPGKIYYCCICISTYKK